MKKETSDMRQKPEVSMDETLEGERLTHPSFGQISARRIQGNGEHLYGSDFTHQNWVEVVIHGSEQLRRVGGDSYFPHKEVVRVAMTESQWATFLSSINFGGAPCTFRRLQGEAFPEIEPLGSKDALFKAALSETVSKSVSRIDELVDALKSDDTKISNKKRGELLSLAALARQDIVANAPFVVEQFGEHMEERVEEAKSAINAYANSRAISGLPAAVGSDAGPLALAAPDVDGDE
jgi:hypothetical protein